MLDRLLSAYARKVCALFGIAGVLALAGCGGGNGAPNNPYDPPPPITPPLVVLPAAITIYPGTPATATITGGIAPYQAFSSDSNVLPVSTSVNGGTIVLSANNVTTATVVTLTIRDAVGTSTPLAVTVNPSPLLPSLITITGNQTPGCDTNVNTICSGSTGTATLKVTGNGGLGVQGRSVRFEVVQGTFQIVSTNPAQPLVQSLTVTTDQNGDATAILSVPPNTPTQFGILRATDLTSGQQITGNFTIQQIATGGAVLSVLPLGLTTIKGPDNTRCSTGVSVAYYIFGGTPPYRVETNFPQFITLTGTPVTQNGGSFTATTNGGCFVNLTFVITDATGRTIAAGAYPTITNELGTNPPTPPLTPLVVTPGLITKNNCGPANTFQFIGTGGVAPYSAVVTASSSSTSPVLVPQTGIAAGTAVTVSGISSPSTTTITLLDNATPRQSGTVTIECTGTAPVPPPPPPSALVVTPQTQGTATTSCTGQTYAFVISGGTGPYNVFFQSPKTGATITPATVTSSGQSFTVANIPTGGPAGANNITIVDSGNPSLVTTASVVCSHT